MKSTRVDAVLGSLRATPSRRTALTALLGVLPGPLLTSGQGETTAAKRKRKKNQRNRRRRKNRLPDQDPCGAGGEPGDQCLCPKLGLPCADDAQCCPSTQHLSCQAEACQPCDVCLSGCEFGSIQAAINAAAPGETIHICGGVFEGSIAIEKDVTLVGIGAGANGTIIDGLGRNTTVNVRNATAELRHLRITGGRKLDADGEGGGIFSQSSKLTLTECTVIRNFAFTRSGGIIAQGSQNRLTLNNSNVIDNESGDAGGGIVVISGAVTLNGSLLRGNVGANLGGGIVSHGGATTLNDSRIEANRCGLRGGGVFLADGTLSLFDSHIENNVSGAQGGGVFRVNGSVSLFDSTVTGNSPDDCVGVDCTNA